MPSATTSAKSNAWKTGSCSGKSKRTKLSQPQEFSFDQLAAIGPDQQEADLTRLGLKHGGDAVRIKALLEMAGVKTSAKYLSLHSSSDDFHASIPLEPVMESALIVYRAEGKPVETKAGGPFRFFIPNSAPCRTNEIDTCANVKFIDRIELTTDKGPDNRRG